MKASEGLLSVSQALERLLAEFQPLESEAVALEEALGRVLAEPLTAPLDLPPFANSSMDGYAVHAADVAGARPETPAALPVVADIPAGAPLPAAPVPAGAAARIMTGAPVPPGVDAIVPIEATDDAQSSGGAPPPAAVRILKAYSPGANVRLAGEDVRAGELVLAAGQVIRPAEVGLLAALGMSRVPVVRRPRVVVLSTGDELVDLGQPLGPGQIHDSNSHTLAALVVAYGGQPLRVGRVPDQLEVMRRRLREAVAAGADLILSSAGVSVGAFDVVKRALEQDGTLGFWRVNMRPGKPVAFGRVQGVPFMGLPGNPVSAAVTFEIFVRPAVLKMAGRAALAKPQVRARLDQAIASDGRESYLRAVVRPEAGGGYAARLTGAQGSNLISSLTRANALLVIPAGQKQVAAGETVTAWMLDWPEEVF
jgi:molybdopterin molybdotransferase